MLAKEGDEEFQNCNEFWISDNAYVEGVVKVRDNCHISGKYRDPGLRDCNISVKSMLWFSCYYERTMQIYS